MKLKFDLSFDYNTNIETDRPDTEEELYDPLCME